MEKRKRNTVLLAFALIVCLSIPSALAVSTSINYNASGTVRSSKGNLNGSLSGKVTSKSTSTNQYGKLNGYLDTHGSVFTVNRDSASVAAGKSSSMYWSNPNNEAGKYSVALTSPGGHNGTGSASS